MKFFKNIDNAMIVRYLILIVIVLLLLGTLVTGLYAKFAAHGEGTDSGRVAHWSVNVTDEADPSSGQTIPKTVTQDASSATFEFSAKNFNGPTISNPGAVTETLTKYTITVALSEKLPDGVKMYIADKDNPSIKVEGTSLDELTYQFDDTNWTGSSWKFEPGKAAEKHFYLLFNMGQDCSSSQIINKIQVSVNYSQVITPTT